jgi:glycosyltransferase involved in cell wall biosynthesis
VIGLPLRGELEQAGATVLGRLGDGQLDAAYADALCLACVSREEGFGFTPLEALAAGVPAVVSDLPVFRETLGDAALMVPADDTDALADALLRLEREPELRESLVAAGRERVQLLSWERAARETRAVFEEALG